MEKRIGSDEGNPSTGHCSLRFNLPLYLYCTVHTSTRVIFDYFNSLNGRLFPRYSTLNPCIVVYKSHALLRLVHRRDAQTPIHCRCCHHQCRYLPLS
jgi:hypothetical protein